MNLPGDVTRYLALTKGMSLRKILDLCQVNKDYYRNICNNETFWRSLLQQRYGYESFEASQLSLHQIKNIIREHETMYTPEQGLDILRHVNWIAGLPDLNMITTNLVPDVYDEAPTAELPQVQAILNKKINFGQPLVLYVDVFHDDDEPDYEDRENGEDYNILDLPAVVSPLEIIASLEAYYGPHAGEMGDHVYFEGLYPFRDGYRISFGS
jgi:hypothetical protein